MSLDRPFARAREEAPLSTREIATARLLAYGSRYKDIAAYFGCSVATVAKHTDSLKLKTNSKTVTEAVVALALEGLLSE